MLVRITDTFRDHNTMSYSSASTSPERDEESAIVINTSECARLCMSVHVCACVCVHMHILNQVCVCVSGDDRDEPSCDNEESVEQNQAHMARDGSDNENQSGDTPMYSPPSQPTQMMPNSQEEAYAMVKHMIAEGLMKPEHINNIIQEGKSYRMDKQLRETLTIADSEYAIFQDKLTKTIIRAAGSMVIGSLMNEHRFENIDKIVKDFHSDASPHERIGIIVDKFIEFNSFGNIETLFNSSCSSALDHFRETDVLVDLIAEQVHTTTRGEPDDDLETIYMSSPSKSYSNRKKRKPEFPNGPPPQMESSKFSPKKRGRRPKYIIPINEVRQGDVISIKNNIDDDVLEYVIVKGGKGVEYDESEINIGEAKKAIKNGSAVKYMRGMGSGNPIKKVS